MDTIIDLGSSKVKITTFDQKKKIVSHLSEKIDDLENLEEISSIIKKLIKNSEKEISNHIEEINILFDDSNFFKIDISIKMGSLWQVVSEVPWISRLLMRFLQTISKQVKY